MNKIRVLIADDIEETRNVIKKILNLDKENIEVVGEADNGEEVFKIIPKVKPDVVLMDINMPVLNGLEATEKITMEYPSVMVIIMSVQAESEYLKKAMFHGAKEYIIKP
jgi:pilus assembly protein CpaE